MSTERYGETRSFFLWFFLGIITAGLCFAIYYYLNFADLDAHYSRVGVHDGAPSTDVEPLLMALLCCLLPSIGTLIAQFVKYSKLHDHVEASGGRRNIPDGLSIVLLNLCLGWTIILPIYYEWKWQDVLNNHIRWHASRGKAPRRDLPTR
jgi:hypothetical protein